jgi:site-specific recombinase XerD
MSLTINTVLFKRKEKKNGEIPIWIRITENRKSRYKSTGISVLPKYWNENQQRIRSTHPKSQVYNRQLELLTLEIEKKKLKLQHEENLDADSLKSSIQDNDRYDLLGYADAYLMTLKEDQRFWESKHFKVVRRDLKGYLKSRKIKIDKVDTDFLDGFQKYLLTEAGQNQKSKGNSPNTVRRKLRCLRAMFKVALKKKEIKIDPFQNFKAVEKAKTTNKVKLSLSQIMSIKQLDLERGSELWHSRNYFLYSFYNAGIRFGDLCTLRWNNLVDGRLVYKMQKTGQQKSIKQNAPMKEILSYYRKDGNEQGAFIFPLLDQDYLDPMELRRSISSKNVVVNRNLKALAKLAGVQANVSFHVSRHSFAHYALKKGVDLYSISKALGHSDLKITEEYLKKFDEEKLDKDMKQLFEGF